jgi:hypothetical protein
VFRTIVSVVTRVSRVPCEDVTALHFADLEVHHGLFYGRGRWRGRVSGEPPGVLLSSEAYRYGRQTFDDNHDKILRVLPEPETVRASLENWTPIFLATPRRKYAARFVSASIQSFVVLATKYCSTTATSRATEATG